MHTHFAIGARHCMTAAVLLSACAGCDKPSTQPASSASSPIESAPLPSAAPAVSAASAATAAPTVSAASSAPADRPNLSPSSWAPPDKPSKPPTVADWQTAEEIEVKNARRLGCEVKMVREWLRVSCRTTQDTASQIQELRWLEPSTKPLEFYDMIKPGTLASIVFPIRRETKARVEFVWTDFSRALTVSWTPGTPQPLIYFAGDAPKDLSKPLCVSVCGIPYFPGRGTMPCPPTHDPTDGEDNGCICRKFANDECVSDW